MDASFSASAGNRAECAHPDARMGWWYALRYGTQCEENHPISFCTCRKKPGGAWRQNGRAAFRRRASAPSPYPLPRSSFPTANRCAGFAVGDRGLLAPQHAGAEEGSADARNATHINVHCISGWLTWYVRTHVRVHIAPFPVQHTAPKCRTCRRSARTACVRARCRLRTLQG